MQEFFALANTLADAAAEIARQYFRQPFDIETKPDDSPVTIADRAIETRLREILDKERPEDGILGEEFGRKDSRNGLTWVLDPIDGTKSFMAGRPTFGTLIALCEEGRPVLGVIDQPILKERWLGLEGQNTLFNGKPIKTRSCPSLEKAVIASTTPAMFATTGPVYERFEEGRMFWGGDCYAYGLLACGHVDLIIEAALSPYDWAALVPVVEGAGGKICDWEGAPLALEGPGQVIALGDPALWGQVADRLR